MLIARAGSARDAILEHLARLVPTACFYQRLCRHLICRGVVRICLEESGELSERGVRLTRVGVLHCQAVAGKGVVGVLREDFLEHSDAIHAICAPALPPWN